MNPVPILFVDHASAVGGAERSLLLILKYLDRSRWQPHLACVGGPLMEEALALGVAVYRLTMPRLRRSLRALMDWAYTAVNIARYAQRVGAALLVANTVRTAFYGALAARFAGVPLVWYMRDFWLAETRPRHLWIDRLGKQCLCAAAVHVIANSHATAGHLPCPDKLSVVYNGIEVNEYDPTMDGAWFRKQYGIPQEVPVVGMVGRLRPWKGQDRFLRVLAQVREIVPAVRGVVVGGNPFAIPNDYPQQLRNLTTELGLEGRVVFTDQLKDVRPALAAMDIFMHPGDPEPFGLVNIEAMAMAKPVVAFAHGALPEIVIDGVTGLLVPAVDEVSMVQAVLNLLQDPARGRRLGIAGRKRVQDCFTAAQMVREVSTILERILQ